MVICFMPLLLGWMLDNCYVRMANHIITSWGGGWGGVYGVAVWDLLWKQIIYNVKYVVPIRSSLEVLIRILRFFEVSFILLTNKFKIQIQKNLINLRNEAFLLHLVVWQKIKLPIIKSNINTIISPPRINKSIQYGITNKEIEFLAIIIYFL